MKLRTGKLGAQFSDMAVNVGGYFVLNSAKADTITDGTYFFQFPFSLTRANTQPFILRPISVSARVSADVKSTVFLASKFLGKTAVFPNGTDD